MQPQIIWNSSIKILIILITESTWIILLQSGFSVKMKGQTNRGRQMNKRMAHVGGHKIPSPTFSGDTEWHTNRVIDKSNGVSSYENLIFI